MKNGNAALLSAWAALTAVGCVLAWAYLLPPGCQWDRASVRCGRACLQLEYCFMASARVSCERVPGDGPFHSGAWDNGAGAVPSGHVACVTDPPEECVRCINASRCDQLRAGDCRAACGELESPRPARPIPIRR